MTLLQIIQGIDPFDRWCTGSVWIEPCATGYQVSLKRELYRQANPEEHVDSLPHLNTAVIVKAADLVFVATWQVPIWDQVVELVADPAMSSEDCLGTMFGTEEARIINGRVAQEDALKYWHVSTHGKSRTPEHVAWLQRITHIPS
jgi:hypothetical protein